MIGDSGIVAHFEEQGDWCDKLGSHFTGALCRAMARDYAAKGIIYDLTKNWQGNPRKDALALRIAGVLHHAVLKEEDLVLVQVYPENRPDWNIDVVWRVAETYIRRNYEHVKEFIQSPPQTNETKRAIALLPGFLELAARFDMPMDLLELGASAGLNLNWDRFNYKTATWERTGSSEVTISTDWNGQPPDHLDATPNIRSREGCDLNPLNVLDRKRALRLKSYTWADQFERLQRLDAAIKLAVETGYHVQQASAVDWLSKKLASRPKNGLTVIYHSVFLVYPPKEEIQKIFDLIEAAGDDATEDNPLAWLCYEAESLFGGSKESPKMYTRLQFWPGGEARYLNRSDGHITKLHVIGD